MIKKLPLRLRLSLLAGAVLAAGLVLGVLLLTLQARTRIRVESEAAMNLAQDFVEATLLQAQDAHSPPAELDRLLQQARAFRHIRVLLEGADAPQTERASRAPKWFASLASARAKTLRIELREPLQGALLIAADPADEIAEIWEEIVELTIGAVLVALILFVLLFVAVSRTLAPLSALADDLARLEQGERSLRIAPSGSPEFFVIADRINALAASLARLDAQNRELLRKLIDVQENERREIARDLHDEIGPFLFAIRAGVGSLQRKADEPEIRDACAKIDAQIAMLQSVNRRILIRLRPAALEEMGLDGALEALVQGWRDTHPEVSVELSVEECSLEKIAALTAYRVVQEGLTNAFRHSGARNVRIEVSREAATQPPHLRIRVADDGVGLRTDWRAGLGLCGMSERLAALGGDASLADAAPRGAALTARLPLAST